MGLSALHIRVAGQLVFLWCIILLSFATGSLVSGTNGEVSMQEDRGDLEKSNGNRKNGDRGLLADPPVRGLIYHAVLFFGVMLVLLALNLRITPENLWVQWIALLWGILIFWNAWQVFSSRGKVQR